MLIGPGLLPALERNAALGSILSARPSALWRLSLAVAAACSLALFPGCDSDGGQPRPRARDPERVEVRDVPAILRDTLGSQTTLTGTQPILVSGYGLVVGLNGTGSGDVPGPVRSIMEREMLLMGVGKESGPLRGMTPNEILSDRNTAVVLITAALPPGAPRGTRFDIRVDALPGTATTSLEGGRLYTSRLFQGLVRPAAPATEPIAEARGPMFLNPYADPAGVGTDSVFRTTARVLDGGVVTQPRRITLTLDAPSHSRVRAMVDAINSRFPRARGEPDVAKGLNEELIELNIPPQFRREPDEFFDVLARVRVDQSFPEEAARRYVDALKEQPELAEPLSRCLQALGEKAIPFVREMYQFPELRPRMAAVEAGARLGDPTVQPFLEELAETGPPGARTRALRLMGELGIDPKINLYLREKLSDPAVDMRIAAYETLSKRSDPTIDRRRMTDKFVLDTVPSSTPMVYVTLQREPKVVVFGGEVPVNRPVFASVWEDRLMVSAESETDPLRVFYRDHRREQATTSDVPSTLQDLIEYMAHKTTPEEPAPGLDMTYSEVVGSLAGLLRKGVSPAQFVPETDKLELELIRLRQGELDLERPEFPGDTGEERQESPAQPLGEPERPDAPEGDAPVGPVQPEGVTPTTPPPARRYVVPLNPPTTGESSKGAPGARTPKKK